MTRRLAIALILLAALPSLAAAQYLSPDSRPRPHNLGNVKITGALTIAPSSPGISSPGVNTPVYFTLSAIPNNQSETNLQLSAVTANGGVAPIINFNSNLGLNGSSGITAGPVSAPYSAMGTYSLYGLVGQSNTEIGFAPSVNLAVGPDTMFTRGASAGIMQQGAADAATAVAQTSGVQNIVAGTAATAGQNRTFNGSRGTYTGAGGNIVLQTAPAALSDSAHTITAFSGTSSPYTITATGSPVYPVGTVVTVASATPGTLNGSYTVTSASAGSFTATTTQTGTWSSGGTAAISTTAQNPLFQNLILDSQTHVRVGNGPAPALTSCGTGSPSILGTDVAGQVTTGTAATGCTITFNYPYASAPFCTVTWQGSPLVSQSYVVSATAITLTQTATTGDLINYHCIAQNGG